MGSTAILEVVVSSLLSATNGSWGNGADVCSKCPKAARLEATAVPDG